MRPFPQSPALHTAAAGEVLLEAVERLADVRYLPLQRSAACLDRTTAPPTLTLHPDVRGEELCAVLIDVLVALTLGPQAARLARPTPPLHSVS